MDRLAADKTTLHTSQNIFCGLGALMIIEVLHDARIHPLTQANFIFNSTDQQELRRRIIQAIRYAFNPFFRLIPDADVRVARPVNSWSG